MGTAVCRGGGGDSGDGSVSEGRIVGTAVYRGEDSGDSSVSGGGGGDSGDSCVSGGG